MLKRTVALGRANSSTSTVPVLTARLPLYVPVIVVVGVPVMEALTQLAGDWTNVDLVAAHRAARDDLSALLARWETLFGG